MQRKCNDDKNTYKEALDKINYDQKFLKDGNNLIISPTTNITIGNGTTGAPKSQAEAYITGIAPKFVLNLTISQGPIGPRA